MSNLMKFFILGFVVAGLIYGGILLSAGLDIKEYQAIFFYTLLLLVVGLGLLIVLILGLIWLIKFLISKFSNR